MRSGMRMALCGALLWLAGGCVNVKAPERIDIGGSRRPAPVDASRVPPTTTHEQARAELAKAYDDIRYLERENRRLAEKAEEYKRERDRCRDRLERYEKD